MIMVRTDLPIVVILELHQICHTGAGGLEPFSHDSAGGGGLDKDSTFGSSNIGSLASGSDDASLLLISQIYYLKGGITTLEEKNQSNDVRINMLLTTSETL